MIKREMTNDGDLCLNCTLPFAAPTAANNMPENVVLRFELKVLEEDEVEGGVIGDRSVTEEECDLVREAIGKWTAGGAT